MKKILITMNNLDYGGMERVVEIIYHLLEDDYNIKIAIYNVAKKELASYPFEDLKCPIKKGNISKVLFFFKRIYKTVYIKMKYKPDITLSFGQQANYLNYFTRFLGKTIINIRGYGWVENPLFGDRIESKMYQSVTKTIAVSQKIRINILEKFNLNSNKIDYLYNPFDITNIKKKSEFELTFEEKKLFSGGFNLIAVGRIADDKGFYHLVKAISLIKSENINLIIIGDGPRINDLKILISKLKLNKNIKLLGSQDNPYKFMKYSDGFILSSIREGFPNVLVEAMAVGLPVIATNCSSGPSEIIANQVNLNLKNEYRKFESGFLIRELSDSKDYNYENIEICDQTLALSLEAIIKELNNTKIRTDIIEHAQNKCLNMYNYEVFKNKLSLILDELYGEN
ncbi:glycosyltransferase [Enterococcus casseliflavus]|uniref:glycosyltransferase n=1 Tax=Enterococcus casseliflavus TaxID=37734 RepID=UPI002953C429|nr:glycosyltransferase [Enterococcus casseliflavus]MDV7702659.1 glycosyltransferase [Enterococcus casseliflavus]